MSQPNNSTIADDTVIAAACVLLLALVIILFLLYYKRNKGQTTTTTGRTTVKLPARSLRLFELAAATANFHPSLVVGKGPLGTVFKASSSSAFLAVKRIHPSIVLSHAGAPRFSSKLKSLSLLPAHPNVVPVLGYCEAPGERVIVAEFVAGGRSLDTLLHGEDGEELSWRARARVAAGAARGIEHLHAGSTVHGRVTASNILVGDGFGARVCDYGLPELLAVGDGEGGKEGDVYGFGVVLLEVLSGRRRSEVVEWALPLIREGRIGEALDRRIGLPKDVGPLVRMAKVASACVGNGRRSRPAMAHVAAILSSLEVEFCR